MTDFSGVNNTAVQQAPIPMVKDKHSNQYRASFKAENDQFVRQDKQTRPAILQNQNPQLQMVKLMEQQQKEEKKRNFWSKFALFAGIAASLAIVFSIFVM